MLRSLTFSLALLVALLSMMTLPALADGGHSEGDGKQGKGDEKDKGDDARSSKGDDRDERQDGSEGQDGKKAM